MRKIQTNSLWALCLTSGLIGGCMVRPAPQTLQPTGETGSIRTSITLPAQTSTQVFGPASINSLRIELLGTYDNTPDNNYVGDPYHSGKRLVAYANRISAGATSIHVAFPSVPIGKYLIRVTTSPFLIQNLPTSAVNSMGVIDNTAVTVKDCQSLQDYVGVLPANNPGLYSGTPIKPETTMDRSSGPSMITLNTTQDSLAIDLNGSGTYDSIDLNGDGKYDGLDINGDGDASDSVTFAVEATTSVYVLPETEIEKRAEQFAKYLFVLDNGVKLGATPSFLDPKGLYSKSAGYGMGYGAVVVNAGQNAGVAVRVLSTTVPASNGAPIGSKFYDTTVSGTYTVSVESHGDPLATYIHGDRILKGNAYFFPSWAPWSIGVQHDPNTTTDVIPSSLIGTYKPDNNGDFLFDASDSCQVGANTRTDIVMCNENKTPVLALGRISEITEGNGQSFKRYTSAKQAELYSLQASFDNNGNGYLTDLGGIVTDLPPILDTNNYVYKVYYEFWGEDSNFGDNTFAGIAKTEDNVYSELGSLFWVNTHVSVVVPQKITALLKKSDVQSPAYRLVVGLAKKNAEKPCAIFYTQNGNTLFN